MILTPLLSFLSILLPGSTVLATGGPLQSLAGLPVELREHVYQFLDIKHYANLLNASRAGHLVVAASQRFEWDLLRKAAREIDRIDSRTWSGVRRRQEILSGVQTLVRVCSQRSPECEGRDREKRQEPDMQGGADTRPPANGQWAAGMQEEAEVRQTAYCFQQRFAEYAGLSTIPLWHVACMAALADVYSLDDSLTDTFVKEHLNVVVYTTVMLGNLDLLNKIIAAQDLSPNLALSRSIFHAAAHNGSISLFEEICSTFPWNRRLISSTTNMALAFGQYNLFRHLLQKRLSNRTAMALGLQQIITNDGLFRVCQFGTPFLARELLESCQFWRDRSVVTKCLVLATISGNLPVVKDLLGNNGPHKGSRQTDFYLPTTELGPIMAVAARSVDLDVLRFLLFELDERRDEELEPWYQEAMEQALLNGSLEAFEMILGPNRHGVCLAPGLVFNREDHRLLVSLAEKGRLEVIEYLIKRKEGVDDSDARWNSLEFNAAGQRMLRAACSNGHLAMVQFILRGGHRLDGSLFATVDPGAEDNVCLIDACHFGWRDIVHELLQLDDHQRPLYPTVHHPVPNNQPLRNAVAGGHLEVVRYLLRREPDENREPRYVLPEAALCIRDRELIRVACAHQAYHVLDYLLERDATGNPLHPHLSIPPGFLATAASRDWIGYIERALEHPIEGRWDQIRQAILEARNLRTSYLLVDALHGPLPALDTTAGVTHLADILVTQRYFSPRRGQQNLLAYPTLDPWDRRLTRRWIALVCWAILERASLYLIRVVTGTLLVLPVVLMLLVVCTLRATTSHDKDY